MSVTRSVYKVVRSVVFTAVLTVVALIAILYIAVSVPAVQRTIKETAERELTALLGGKVSISSAEIFPFNEVRLYGVSIYTPSGKRCVSVGRIGAGIDLWTLISSGEIEIAYAEIISLDANVVQAAEGAPLNIQFIIDALSSKEKKTPPAQFKVVLHNVVIRKSNILFDRTYIPRNGNSDHMDFNHIALSDFRADVALPLIANDDFEIDLRRLAFAESSGFVVKSLSVKAHVTPRELSFRDLVLKTANSTLSVSSQSLKINGYGDVMDALSRQNRSVTVEADPLYPSDFSPFAPQLADFGSRYSLVADVSGNLENLALNHFSLREANGNCSVELAGEVSGVSDSQSMKATVERLQVYASATHMADMSKLIPSMSQRAASIVSSLGDVSIDASAHVDLAESSVEASADVHSSAGDVMAAGDISWKNGEFTGDKLTARAEAFNIGSILGIADLGLVSLEAEGNLSVLGKLIEGNVTAAIPYVDYKGTRFENIVAEANKTGDLLNAHLEIADRVADLTADAGCLFSGTASHWNAEVEVRHLFPAMFGIGKFNISDMFAGTLSVDLSGNSPDNLSGYAAVNDFVYRSAKVFRFDRIELRSDITDSGRSYNVDSDFLSGMVSGDFKPTDMVGMVRNLVAQTLPTFVKEVTANDPDGQYADFSFTIPQADDFYSLIGSSVRPGVPVTISGSLSGENKTASLRLEAPYLVKGRDKLIKNTGVSVLLASGKPAQVNVSTLFPMKNDRAALDVTLSAIADHADARLNWAMQGNADNKGTVGLAVDVERRMLSNAIGIDAFLHNSGFRLNGADWEVSPASVSYSDKSLEVENLRIAHGAQFVDIGGKASDNPLDVITARLAGIDLEYIFDILNINHVDFGGIAPGTARVSSLFTSAPVAMTDGLFVKNLAYNGCVLGDGDLEGHWDNEEKMVAINADIEAADKSSATVRGGVYVTRDSLSFDFHANKLDIRFLQPFMSGFTSSVTGRASGDVKLYGTFSDIDLGGRVFADTITMKVDYTNVYYSGSDSLFFSPGRISIPHIRLYDRYGNSCELQGEVRHDFLRDATFDFDMTGAKRLLVYDTNQKMNPQWFGKVFANGSARLRGLPGLVSINVNMSTAPNSEFTIVLDETQTAIDYTFLTFSDRRKEEREKEEVTVSFEDAFKKTIINDVQERPDLFALDLSLDVTPGANLVIVMDPQAGDKIKANGSGALQMHYDSDSDDFTLYGKYTLNRGDYNFSLQDLILKNFKIQEGSSISFNGDPLEGLLDITAAYRVNTNLTDLDRSFTSDPDLNRTSVPVDALLKVRGDIHSPEIKFDIKLPTVTSEVERKVRSIISTEDMMNRQVIYLLALNRFYTPEYMGAEQGGELASVASSTLSSQIQNIVGSLTDKFSVAPSFKSEKSDFSDMEVDVALSSSLFDNRLLINGNLGYRDRSTSQTTFIGDFDLEYLLSRDGRLRLKAYNHFNDASYYLKSALTTQGIGIIYRKDFDDPFTFLKRMFRRKKKSAATNADNKGLERNSTQKTETK